ncbi:MAG TPA: hypothetical protein VNW47_10960 [Terriglobales bacterium]|jgi:hypothetical protein|nr:hypothetical protein [Terriglobales bacterium]
MRILLLHAEDTPVAGPWASQHWDLVYDLARGGWAACERWSGIFHCPVRPIDSLRNDDSQLRKVRELLQFGLGQLVDREGLDWWELTALLVHYPLERLVLLRKMASDLPPEAEVWVSRAGFEAAALQLSAGVRVHVFAPAERSSHKGLRHYMGRLKRLPASQVLQILGDKFDAGYRVRRHFHRRTRPNRRQKPTVLVPSSYINMSLTGAAYAEVAPETDFLLVSTRSSGRLRETPHNVTQAWLASYAGDSGASELADILQRWVRLKTEIASVPELAALGQLGLMDDFVKWFENGLAIRNAWLEVLKSEPVQAVLCCDDSNPHTHIPLLLARQRGLPTVACHHGALDGRHLIKKNHADVILAKGRMEQDYLVRACRVDESVVEIGAPSLPEASEAGTPEDRDWIVFFSEPYDMTGGRAEEIYRDILPGLVRLAQSVGKRVVVKLHPAENLPDRQNLARRVLGPEQWGTVEWFTGRLGPELMRRTWFGITVQSSVAVECVIHGVPCFVCEWMDLWPYGYMAQYRKFGVGIGLHAPADIVRIPEMLAANRLDRTVADACWQVIRPKRLEEILAGRRASAAVPESIQRAP